jgi:hypothetical protein
MRFISLKSFAFFRGRRRERTALTTSREQATSTTCVQGGYGRSSQPEQKRTTDVREACGESSGGHPGHDSDGIGARRKSRTMRWYPHLRTGDSDARGRDDSTIIITVPRSQRSLDLPTSPAYESQKFYREEQACDRDLDAPTERSGEKRHKEL